MIREFLKSEISIERIDTFILNVLDRTMDYHFGCNNWNEIFSKASDEVIVHCCMKYNDRIHNNMYFEKFPFNDEYLTEEK